MPNTVNNDFLYPTWEENGFTDVMDEMVMQRALINTQLAVQRFEYSNNFIFAQGTSFMDIGDEWYGGATFAYIPTEMQIGSAIALMQRHSPNEGPVYYDDPGMNSLLNGLYRNAQDFWKELAQANSTGW